jgi:hypothetical protein
MKCEWLVWPKAVKGKRKARDFILDQRSTSLTHDTTPNNRRECFFCMILRDRIMPYLLRKVSIFNFTPP